MPEILRSVDWSKFYDKRVAFDDYLPEVDFAHFFRVLVFGRIFVMAVGLQAFRLGKRIVF